jgi:hypothetical protein
MFLSYRECVAVPRYGIACCGFAPDDTCLELGMSPNEKFREMLKGPLFPCVTHFNGPNPRLFSIFSGVENVFFFLTYQVENQSPCRIQRFSSQAIKSEKKAACSV